MIHALILAGGSGERFWPKSRLREPKQFLRLEGRKSLLQTTVDRLEGVIPRNRLYVVSLASQAGRIRQELPFLKRSQLVGEPIGKNTAAAIALGTAQILKRDPTAIVCVFPCDQWIGDRRAFRYCLTRAIERAKKMRSIVLFGIKPTRPETGYGYIEVDRRMAKGGLYPVRRFIEKPSLPRARRLLRSKGIFWNSGMFVFKGLFLAEALRASVPSLAGAFARELRQSLSAGVLRRLYATLPSVSFDTGVLERFSYIECVRATFEWEDLGSWLSVERRLFPDRSGNRMAGIAFTADAKRNLVVSDERHLVSLFGVSDLAVIHTDEATLVCAKDRLRQLKNFIQTLKEKKDLRSYL